MINHPVNVALDEAPQSLRDAAVAFIQNRNLHWTVDAFTLSDGRPTLVLTAGGENGSSMEMYLEKDASITALTTGRCGSLMHGIYNRTAHRWWFDFAVDQVTNNTTD